MMKLRTPKSRCKRLQVADLWCFFGANLSSMGTHDIDTHSQNEYAGILDHTGKKCVYNYCRYYISTSKLWMNYFFDILKQCTTADQVPSRWRLERPSGRSKLLSKRLQYKLPCRRRRKRTEQVPTVLCFCLFLFVSGRCQPSL